MRRKVKERLIALMCVVVMVCSMCYVTGPKTVEAGTDTITTVSELLASGFEEWTFEDVALGDDSVSGNLNWNDWKTNSAGPSLDRTVFRGRVNFSDSTTSFGNFYIGGDTAAEGSNWRGFVFRGYNDSNPNLTFGFQGDDGIFYDENGATNNQIAVFTSETTGIELRGNKHLELALSVEYTSVKNDLVTMQVGVFFNGVLCNGQYYTVKDVPEEYLTKSFRWYGPQGSNAIYSAKEVTLETAPEREFTSWTLQDAGVKDYVSFSTQIGWNDFNTTAAGSSMKDSIFCAKVNFDSGVSKFGEMYVGGNYAADTSKYRGFRFESFGTTDKLALGFYGTGGMFFNENGNTNTSLVTEASQIAIFDSAVAGTTLRDNANLQVALSVEYLTDVATNGTVDIKVGVFFDGKLYNNEYYTVKGIAANLLTQNVRFYMGSAASGVDNAITSDTFKQISLETAPEKDFTEWTFSDAGVSDYKSFSSNINWSLNSQTTGATLDQTIFHGKFNFDGNVSNCGNLYLGGNYAAVASNYQGFRFTTLGTNDQIALGFMGASGHFYNASGSTGSGSDSAANQIVVCDSKTAGTTLRSNPDLQVSLSVEEISTVDTNGLVKVKIGLFFDGILYNGRYYYAKIPANILTQSARVHMASANSGVANALYSSSLAQMNDIYLYNSAEKDFTYWTMRDIECSDYTFSGNWNWKTPYITDPIDKTIFNAKVLFPSDSDGFGNFYIGGATSGSDLSAYRGFLIRGNSGTGKLNIAYQQDSGNLWGGNVFAVFDPTTAGTTLRGNADLQLSISVEVLETKASGLADVRVGVFFDGKLYDNTYYTLTDMNPIYLSRNVRWYGAPDSEAGLKSVLKTRNVAAAANGGTAYTSHLDKNSEHIGYGVDTLIDGVAAVGKPYYKGVSSSYQYETMTQTFEFDDTYNIDHIRMYNQADAGGFPIDFTWSVLTSSGWKVVVGKDSYRATMGWNDFHFADVSTTAVRLTVHQNGTDKNGYGLHLGEVEVYGTETLDDHTASYSLTEEAIVVVPGTRDEAASDGAYVTNAGHRYLTTSAGGTLRAQVVFERAVTVKSVQIHANEPGRFATGIGIYVFRNGGWTHVYSQDGYTCGSAQTMHEFTLSEPASCHGMMITLSGMYPRMGGYGMELQEIRVNGDLNIGSHALFGDINSDGDLTEAVEYANMKNVLLGKATASIHTDFNMDGATGAKDLIRMKRYFARDEYIEKSYDVTCMTWNVLAWPADGYEAPSTRAPKIANAIRTYGKDIVCVQEAGGTSYNWASGFDQMLCDDGMYEAVKISDSSAYRTGCLYYKNEGVMYDNSGLIIYYKPSRFTKVDYGCQRYMSSEISSEYGNRDRWFLWVQLLDKQSGETIFVINTHWSANVDSNGNENTTIGAQLHAKQSAELRSFLETKVGDRKVFCVGDFNTYETDSAIQNLNNTTYFGEANAQLGDLGSIKEHIDHIFVQKKAMEVINWEQVAETYTSGSTSYRCSDHDFYATKIRYVK